MADTADEVEIKVELVDDTTGEVDGILSNGYEHQVKIEKTADDITIEDSDSKFKEDSTLDDYGMKAPSLENPDVSDTSDIGSVSRPSMKFPLRPPQRHQFSCNICEFKCTRYTALRSHMRVHTGEKPFSCDNCAFRCWQPQRLTNHMKIHLGEMAYSCTLCDYKCNTAGTLKNHSQFHTGEKAHYACSDCNFRCGAAVEMRRHIWKNHS